MTTVTEPVDERKHLYHEMSIKLSAALKSPETAETRLSDHEVYQTL
jgi:hypothetical protein